jgi:hypothetical protein
MKPFADVISLNLLDPEKGCIIEDALLHEGNKDKVTAASISMHENCNIQNIEDDFLATLGFNCIVETLCNKKIQPEPEKSFVKNHRATKFPTKQKNRDGFNKTMIRLANMVSDSELLASLHIIRLQNFKERQLMIKKRKKDNENKTNRVRCHQKRSISTNVHSSYTLNSADHVLGDIMNVRNTMGVNNEQLKTEGIVTRNIVNRMRTRINKKRLEAFEKEKKKILEKRGTEYIDKVSIPVDRHEVNKSEKEAQESHIMKQLKDTTNTDEKTAALSADNKNMPQANKENETEDENKISKTRQKWKKDSSFKLEKISLELADFLMDSTSSADIVIKYGDGKQWGSAGTLCEGNVMNMTYTLERPYPIPSIFHINSVMTESVSDVHTVSENDGCSDGVPGSILEGKQTKNDINSKCTQTDIPGIVAPTQAITIKESMDSSLKLPIPGQTFVPKIGKDMDDQKLKGKCKNQLYEMQMLLQRVQADEESPVILSSSPMVSRSTQPADDFLPPPRRRRRTKTATQYHSHGYGMKHKRTKRWLSSDDRKRRHSPLTSPRLHVVSVDKSASVTSVFGNTDMIQTCVNITDHSRAQHTSNELYANGLPVITSMVDAVPHENKLIDAQSESKIDRTSSDTIEHENIQQSSSSNCDKHNEYHGLRIDSFPRCGNRSTKANDESSSTGRVNKEYTRNSSQASLSCKSVYSVKTQIKKHCVKGSVFNNLSTDLYEKEGSKLKDMPDLSDRHYNAELGTNNAENKKLSLEETNNANVKCPAIKYGVTKPKLVEFQSQYKSMEIMSFNKKSMKQKIRPKSAVVSTIFQTKTVQENSTRPSSGGPYTFDKSLKFSKLLPITLHDNKNKINKNLDAKDHCCTLGNVKDATEYDKILRETDGDDEEAQTPLLCPNISLAHPCEDKNILNNDTAQSKELSFQEIPLNCYGIKVDGSCQNICHMTSTTNKISSRLKRPSYYIQKLCKLETKTAEKANNGNLTQDYFELCKLLPFISAEPKQVDCKTQSSGIPTDLKLSATDLEEPDIQLSSPRNDAIHLASLPTNSKF